MSTVTGNPLTPPGTLGGRRRTRRKAVAIGVAVALALGIGWFTVDRIVSGEPECADGILLRDNECVGVTDGSFVFDERLGPVQKLIKAENDKVAGSPSVTIAYLGPLTSTPTSSASIDRVRYQLEGAVVAQHNANAAGTNPKIRFVLANEGRDERSWQVVTEKLIAMSTGPEHLVGVMGLSLSVAPTVSGAQALTRAGIPVVGATLTADSLNTEAAGLGVGTLPGLTRVNPSVADEFSALAAYLPTRPDLRTAMLVNDNNEADLYTSTLARDFTSLLGSYWTEGGRRISPYNGAPNTPGIDNQFQTIAASLCGKAPPDMVFYAGRAALLPDFVAHLRARNCERDRTITVVTGSDATTLRATLAPVKPGLDAPVSVLYAALVDPAVLRDPELNPESEQYLRFEQSFVLLLHVDKSDLDDGWAIMTHDSMLATIQATALATRQSSTLPSPIDVRNQLYLLNSETTAVQGAGGSFTIDSVTGNANNRRVPVLELRPDGAKVTQAVHAVPH